MMCTLSTMIQNRIKDLDLSIGETYDLALSTISPTKGEPPDDPFMDVKYRKRILFWRGSLTTIISNFLILLDHYVLWYYPTYLIQKIKVKQFSILIDLQSPKNFLRDLDLELFLRFNKTYDLKLTLESPLESFLTSPHPGIRDLTKQILP